ncbi:hypothetical protein TNCT_342571 [Trichonephila clavata]|uniref:Uncharacterized protein n=1 Tax=Trichonephila clavata TaxID=2740835 RepID=A0A8X6LH24_TRICU|nr:hypothetical protein TNCT_342571 [Trichonephila clavata]
MLKYIYTEIKQNKPAIRCDTESDRYATHFIQPTDPPKSLFPFHPSTLVPGVPAPLDSRSGVAIAASVDIEKELVRWPVVREGWPKTYP